MSPTPAPACKAALAQATERWPKRMRLSDGILASPTHSKANPTSDHELGNAFDLTHDPAHGVDCHILAQHLTADRRVRYIIWNRCIWNPSVSARWRAYDGSNPHTKHMHVSIRAASRDDCSPWWNLPTSKEAAVSDDPNLPNITGPLTFHPVVDANGICQGYYVFAPTTGEVHGHGPGAPYHGRSEDPTP